MWQQFKIVLSNRKYLLNAFGQAGVQATLGGLQVWLTDFVEEYYGIAPLTAVVIMGAMTIFSGIF
jgi:hypothetical protein